MRFFVLRECKYVVYLVDFRVKFRLVFKCSLVIYFFPVFWHVRSFSKLFTHLSALEVLRWQLLPLSVPPQSLLPRADVNFLDFSLSFPFCTIFNRLPPSTQRTFFQRKRSLSLTNTTLYSFFGRKSSHLGRIRIMPDKPAAN
jgi:hypothetical protein